MNQQQLIEQIAKEAAQAYFDSITEPVLQNPARYEGYKDGFSAGAEWMQGEGERKEAARYWYMKPFTSHPKFRAIAERQFEELWALENAKPQTEQP